MKKQLNRFLRWLLFIWVRVEVFPENRESGVFDVDRPVLYVLADRGLSDLLVLQEVCHRQQLPNPLSRLPIDSLRQHHSVYSLASRNPLIDWVRRRRKQSVMLPDLVTASSDNPMLDLQVVPVSVFWGRPLARQKNWLQVLFADTWSIAGRLRKFFTVLIHGRNARLIFSEALSLEELVSQHEGDAQDLQEALIVKLQRQREATFGPQVTSHRHLSARVLEDRIVNKLVIAPGESVEKSLARVHRYCREIFADCTQMTIEVMLRLLRAFWSRYFERIRIYNIDAIRKAALTHQLVYVPCHRSHVDYLLLSYVIYTENLAIPYIAAGSNLNVPFIGRILRGGGAYFIRRSFKDNALYSAVLRAYVFQLGEMGVPLEYFVEGGRSRTGRLLKPRFGMLGMTVEAYMKSRKRPVAFVPVYIGYEKLVEGKSYLGELYGEKKKRESTLGALRAIFHLKGHFGEVTTSFGKPIDLQELLTQHCEDWPQRINELEDRPDWYNSALSTLADKIMAGINNACVINPVNSIATILLATTRQSIEIEELIEQANLHRQVINHIPSLASVHIADKVSRETIERIARQKLIHIKQHELGDIVYLKHSDAVLMSYYRNNSLPAIVLPALLACCFINNRRLSLQSIRQKIQLLYPFLRSELQLEWQEQELETLLDECIDSLVNLSLLEKSDGKLSRPPRSNHEFVQMLRLGQIVQPILERYYMTFIVLWQTSSAPLTMTELEHRCHLLAQKISMIHGINSPDFFDRLLFRDFIETMIENEYLVVNDQDQLEFAEDFDYLRVDIRSLLSAEVRSSILSLIRPMSASAPT